MDSEDEDYEFDVDTAVPFEHDRTVGYRSHGTTSPSSSDLGDDSDNPIERPPQPLVQAMDIPSVRPSSAGISDFTGRPSVHP